MMETKLKEDIKKKFNDLMRFVVELIQSSSKSAFALLENLMNWARQQTGDIPLQSNSVCLRTNYSSRNLTRAMHFKKISL